MNIAVTNAAEGLVRRAFNVGELRRMIDIGVLHEHEKLELIGGDIVMMAAKGYSHDLIKNALNLAIARALPDRSTLAVENSFQLSDDVLVESDLAVLSRVSFKRGPDDFPQPEEMQLVIEVAVSSLNYDRSLKARIYARHNVLEFWVIDANERKAWIHTGPSGDGWTSIVERGPNDALTTPFIPGLSICLGEIEE